jgi:hypothetical protein
MQRSCLTSAKIGTVLLTGLAMMRNRAVGQLLAQAFAMSLTMPALVLNRSSRVMPCSVTATQHIVVQQYARS